MSSPKNRYKNKKFGQPRTDVKEKAFLSASVTVEDAGIAQVSVESTGQDSMVRIRSTHLGTTSMTVRDGENEYRYLLTIYLDHQGAVQVEIKPRDD